MKKRLSKYILILTLLFDLFFCLIVLKGGASLLVQTKMSIFAKYKNRISSIDLEKIIDKDFKYQDKKSNLFKKISSETQFKIEKINNNASKEDCIYLKNKILEPTVTDCKVYGILNEFLPGKGGKKCGLKGDLKTRLNKVYENVGCCSDFSESFLAHSLLAGLKVREVYDGQHITAEYFDNETQNWKWIDPQYKQQIILNGKILSTYEIYRSSFVEDHQLFDPIDKKYYSPYLSIANRNMVGYVLGNNIFEVDKFEQKLDQIYLPKSFVQLISHSLSIRPSYLNIRLNSDKNLQELYKYINIIVLLILFLLNYASIYITVVFLKKRK